MKSMMPVLEKRRSNILDLINWAGKCFSDSGIVSSRQEAELLLSFLLDCSRGELYTDREHIISAEIAESFKDFVTKRCLRTPLQYLTKETYFYGLKLAIDEGVFIPRPETEMLVERVINIINENFSRPVRILELCTGSGNIAVALTKNLADCTIVATDINRYALETARDNAENQGVAQRICFLQGDLFSALKINETGIPAETFDIIIANPPYIVRQECSDLPPEVCCEPRNALDGGDDGLMFYRSILAGCAVYLRPSGFIAFECGDKQSAQIGELVQHNRVFECLELFSDLNGISRFVSARKVHG
ncbi:MAG: peptide chain release factor N(5)-glutamine methyltransferase [PVC group bacterium]|nr:peptide chain release factor N(5)-glutamine methyltransferase [PVC group bacterium]